VGRPTARPHPSSCRRVYMLYRTSALLIGRAPSSHLSVDLRRDAVFAHSFSRVRKRSFKHRRQRSPLKRERDRERFFSYNNMGRYYQNSIVYFTGFSGFENLSIDNYNFITDYRLHHYALAPALLTMIFLFRETYRQKSFNCAHRKHHVLIIIPILIC